MNRKKKIIRAFKRSKDYKTETNDSALKKVLDGAGQHDCKYCPKWEHDNKVSRTPKRGTKKPRYKDKR